jgi:hypothetical protein
MALWDKKTGQQISGFPAAPRPPAGQQAPTNQFGSKAPDMSAYKPGAAQPMQSQSQGTQYGQLSYRKPEPPKPAAPDPYERHREALAGRSLKPPREPIMTPTMATGKDGKQYFLTGLPPMMSDGNAGAMYSEPVWRAGDLGSRAVRDEYDQQARAYMNEQNRRTAAPRQRPYMADAVYAQGTDPGYMQANPDDMPFRPGMRGDAMGYPRPSNTAFVDAWNNAPMMGMEPTSRTPAYSFGGEGPGNLAYMPEGFRPPPFQAAFQNFDGSVTDTPLFGQRDAFIQNINDRDFQYMAGMEQGRPMYDFGSMWGQAGDMVADGWQNPLAGLFNYG